MAKTYSTNSIREFMTDVLSLQFFQPNAKHNNTPAIDTYLHEGECPLITVIGDNACGKSILRRCVASALNKMDHERIHISQQGRSSGEGRIQRLFVYGSEEEDSTGFNSVKSVLTAIKTSKARTTKHTIFFDEPDIGLSDNNAAGVGVAIREFIQNKPEHLFAVFVVSHNKHLMAELNKCSPWNLRMGDAPPLAEWLVQPVVPADITQLPKIGHARYDRIEEVFKIMNEMRKAEKN